MKQPYTLSFVEIPVGVVPHLGDFTENSPAEIILEHLGQVYIERTSIAVLGSVVCIFELMWCISGISVSSTGVQQYQSGTTGGIVL